MNIFIHVGTELLSTWLETRDTAQQGHLLHIRFSTVASNSQVGGWEGGVGGGEGWLLTGFSLDGSIRSWLFKPACLEKEQTWGKRGVSCSREVVLHFGCHSQQATLATSKQSDGMREKGNDRKSEKERRWESETDSKEERKRKSRRCYWRELSESLAVAPLSRSLSCGVESHATWPPCFSAYLLSRCSSRSPPLTTFISLVCSLSVHSDRIWSLTAQIFYSCTIFVGEVFNNFSRLALWWRGRL